MTIFLIILFNLRNRIKKNKILTKMSLTNSKLIVLKKLNKYLLLLFGENPSKPFTIF